MGDIYIAAHLRRCLRHSVFGHVLQYTPSTSVLDALHLHHAIKSPPLRYPSPLHIAFIEVKNELVKTKNVFQMKVNTHTITHQKKKTNIDTYIIMYQANFAGGRSRLDLLLPSFLPSREEKKKQERRKQSIDSGAEWHNPHMDRVRIEKKKQDRIFCPLRGHAVGRMQYAPTSYRQETLYLINSREERTETKMQEQKNHPLDSRAEWHNPYTDRVRIETKKQEQFFCPLWGHAVGRMQYAPTSCRQETLFPINFREERTETKIQERIKQSIDSGAEWHTPFMRQGKKKTVWRDTFLEQRARVAVWRDRRLEEKSSHARLQPRVSGKNSKPYKSYLVALSEQLRDIFAG